MRRTLNWLGSLFWQDPANEEVQANNDGVDEAAVQPLAMVKRDLIDPLEHPIELLVSFDPETVAGWNFMVRTLNRQNWLTCYSMNLKGQSQTAERKLLDDFALKITGIAMGDDKYHQEEVNHAILHDIRRPVVKGQFYPEVYRIFAVYMRPIYCRHSVITLLYIRAYRAETTLLYEGGELSRSFKWLPKEIVVLIAKYLWGTRRQRCWDKK